MMINPFLLDMMMACAMDKIILPYKSGACNDFLKNHCRRLFSRYAALLASGLSPACSASGFTLATFFQACIANAMAMMP